MTRRRRGSASPPARSSSIPTSIPVYPSAPGDLPMITIGLAGYVHAHFLQGRSVEHDGLDAEGAVWRVRVPRLRRHVGAHPGLLLRPRLSEDGVIHDLDPAQEPGVPLGRVPRASLHHRKTARIFHIEASTQKAVTPPRRILIHRVRNL